MYFNFALNLYMTLSSADNPFKQIGTFLEKLSAYDRLHIVPIKGVECQTWRCDVSDFRFKVVVYLSGI